MEILKKLAVRDRNAGSCAPVMLAFLGDSVTHGCFEIFPDAQGGIGVVYEPDSAYPYRLKRRLDAMYPAAAVSVLNAGVSGENAVQGLARLERDVLSRKPDLVAVAFGLNDSMSGDEGLETYRSAMTEIVRRVLDSGAECIVVTPCHMCSYVPGQLTEPMFREIAARAAEVQNGGVLSRYAQAAREAALSQGASVADVHRVWDRMAENGVDTTRLLCNHINHPDRDSHDIYVKTLLDAMMEN